MFLGVFDASSVNPPAPCNYGYWDAVLYELLPFCPSSMHTGWISVILLLPGLVDISRDMSSNLESFIKFFGQILGGFGVALQISLRLKYDLFKVMDGGSKVSNLVG
jgi:hypothetical protein